MTLRGTTSANTPGNNQCPFCGSDDLVEDGHKVTCMECEANSLAGHWASPKALRRARQTQATVKDAFDA